MIVLNERLLHRLLSEFVAYCHDDRTHLGLGKGTPSMRTAVSKPNHDAAIVGCDSIPQPEENVAIAREFTPLSATQMAALEERAKPVHEQALFFRRWEA